MFVNELTGFRCIQPGESQPLSSDRARLTSLAAQRIAGPQTLSQSTEETRHGFKVLFLLRFMQ